MHISYDDIVSRIAEPPTWWHDGIPRYDEFRPRRLLAGFEVLLVHIRCQFCGRDFNVALSEARPLNDLYRKRLSTQMSLGVIGDPPSHGCTGDTMSAEEVAVVEYWQRLRDPNKGFQDWHRVPEFERSLEMSIAAQEERHLEAWSRIRRFRARPEGLMPVWTPMPVPEEFPTSLPGPRIERSATTGKFIDYPELNQRRRLALLALMGRISADEFADLKGRSQREYSPFEKRPPGPRPAWAESLVEEVRSIDETVIANAIVGYGELSAEQREERYFHGIYRLLFELAISGRITPEERMQVVWALLQHRCTF